MEYLLKTKYFTNQRNFIERQGDAAWEAICDRIRSDHFKRTDVAAIMAQEFLVSPRTARSFAYALVANCLLMPAGGMRRVSGNLLRWYGPIDE